MTWGVPLSVSYHFAFHTGHGVLKARILKWLAIPFSSGPPSIRPLHHDPPILGGPMGMAWFHWVRHGCIPSVIRLTSFLWLWFQCVCPLMEKNKRLMEAFWWERLTVGEAGGNQYSVNGYSAESCNFGVLTGEEEHMSFYSAFLPTPSNNVNYI